MKTKYWKRVSASFLLACSKHQCSNTYETINMKNKRRLELTCTINAHLYLPATVKSVKDLEHIKGVEIVSITNI